MSVAITTTIEHIAGSILDYSIEWSDLLVAGETISSSLWVVVSGIVTIGNSLTDPSPSTSKAGAISGTKTVIGLMTGAAGQTAVLKNTMTTSANRAYVRVGRVSIISAV